MLIKGSVNRRASQAVSATLKNIRSRLSFRILFVIFAIVIVFLAGASYQRFKVLQLVYTKILSNTDLPKHFIKGFFSHAERISLDIPFKEFQQLSAKRQEALRIGRIITTKDSWVKGRIRYQDKDLSVKLRLKGDDIDHLDTDKWSLRVKVRDDSTLFGMKRFSLQHPKVRNHVWEWIYLEAVRREGLIALRYKFVDVSLNGVDMGVYAIEESFEKRLVEHNGRREAPIVKFDETSWWTERDTDKRETEHARPGAGHYYSLPFDMFQTNKTRNDSTLFAQYRIATSLLERFRDGELPTSDVFDTDQLARFLALSDLFGAQHGQLTIQLRFYYNPITSRLEPIPYDNDAGHPTITLASLYQKEREYPWTGQIRQIFLSQLFQDSAFYGKYLATLHRFADPQYVTDFWNDIQPELEDNLSAIFSTYPQFRFSPEVLHTNQKFIRRFLNPVKYVMANNVSLRKRRCELEIANVQQLPVIVTGITVDGKPYMPAGGAFLIPGRHLPQPLSYQNVTFVAYPDSAVSQPDDTLSESRPDIRIHFHLPGIDTTLSDEVHNWRRIDSSLFVDDIMRRESNLGQFPFIDVDTSRKQIIIKPGEWVIDHDMIVPAGYLFICPPDVKLTLTNNAAVISHSPLAFRGDSERPILISADSGQGLVVLNSSGASILEYVHFVSLTNPQKVGWALSGSVTFYNSPVEIRNSLFRNCHSEDALNIVHSDYAITGTVFEGAYSDALDTDFSDGSLEDCTFINSGNDAVDVSGSRLDISQVTIRGAADKGVSLGEGSVATITDLSVRGAKIALAGKDLSEATIKRMKAVGCETGIAVYQKKSEFGGARVNISGLTMQNVQTPYLVENTSFLYVDGARVIQSHSHVYDLIYKNKATASAN